MSGTSASFRRKCRVKSEIKTPVATPSKNFVCEFDSLMREPDKILSIRCLLCQTLSCYCLSLENQFGTWDVVQVYTLEVTALQQTA